MKKTYLWNGTVCQVVFLISSGLCYASSPGQQPHAGDLLREKAHRLQIHRNYLGVLVRDVVSSDVQKHSLSGEAGIWVESVEEGSPASAGGLQKGDVIAEVGPFVVFSVRQFQRLVQEIPSGRPVELVVIRQGQRVSKTVTLARHARGGHSREWMEHAQRHGTDIPVPELRDFTFHLDPHEGTFLFRGRPRLGIKAEGLNEQLAEVFQIPGKEGVLVMEVLKDSPAARSGLRAGDVITTVDGAPVASVHDLRSHIKGGLIKLEIVRDKKLSQLTVELHAKQEEKKGTIRL